MKPYIIVIIISTLFISCNNSEKYETGNNATEILVSDIPSSSGILYSELFDSINFVKLETTSESLIGRIDKILYYKNKYFILDQVQSKSVFVFDDYGKFLGKIGKTGKGPGEYDEPNDIAIDPFSDRVLIYNNSTKSILSYDSNGTFIEKIKLDYWIKSFSVVEENLYALYFDYTKNNNIPRDLEYNLLLINKKGEIVNKAFKFEKNVSFGIGGFSFFNKTNESLLVSPGYSNKIFEVNREFVTLKYFLNFRGNEIPQELFSEGSKSDFNKKLKNSNYAFLARYFDTPNYLLFSFVRASRIYNCFYSKKTGNIKYSMNLVNDMFGLVGGGMISANNNDKVISFFEPSSIDEIKRIYNSALTDGTMLKKELLEYLETMMGEINNEGMKNDLRKNMDLIKSAQFNPTKEEIKFINSIDHGDNPILIIAELKKF